LVVYFTEHAVQQIRNTSM